MSNMLIFKETGSGALAETVAPVLNSGQSWRLEEIRIHLSAVGGAGATNFTAKLDHESGAEYDLVILDQDLTAITDLSFQPDRSLEYGKDTELDIEYDNNNSVTWGLEILYKAI